MWVNAKSWEEKDCPSVQGRRPWVSKKASGEPIRVMIHCQGVVDAPLKKDAIGVGANCYVKIEGKRKEIKTRRGRGIAHKPPRGGRIVLQGRNR